MGAGAGLLGLVAGGSYLLNKETEANRFLEEFPDMMHGAGEVRKYRTSGAKKCLVHILQMHYIRWIEEERMKGVREVQNEIYNIISNLLNRGLISNVYGEGVVDEEHEKRIILHKKESDDILEKSFKENHGLKLSKINDMIGNLELELNDEARIKSKYPDINEAKNYKNKLDQEIKKYKKLIVEEEEYRMDIGKSMNISKLNKSALERLVEEGKIRLLAAETQDANYKAVSAINDSNEFDKMVLDNRENILLKIISDSNNALNIAVYGGAHNFLDNVDRWNNQNIDKKYSLIEVIPKSYMKCIK